MFWGTGYVFVLAGRDMFFLWGEEAVYVQGGLAIIMCFPKSYAFFVMPFLTEIK